MSQYRTPQKTSKYYIPREEYLTVLHFCRQYPLWEAELKVEPDGASGVDTEKEHVQTSNQYDPTSSLAMHRAAIYKKKKMVDDTIRMVARGMDDWVVLGVCYGLTFYQLNEKGIPCGSRMYYEIRRRCYYELSKII